MSQSNSLGPAAISSTLELTDRDKLFRDVCFYIRELFGELSNHSEDDLNSSLDSALAGGPESSAGHKGLKPPRSAGAPLIDKLASSCYAERRLRDKIFDDSTLFGEPAWDILLDVASAEAKGKRLSVSSVCIGSCSPATTGLRWLGILEERGLLRREEDVLDRRRSYIRLTRNGARKLWQYFESLAMVRETNFRLAT